MQSNSLLMISMGFIKNLQDFLLFLFLFLFFLFLIERMRNFLFSNGFLVRKKAPAAAPKASPASAAKPAPSAKAASSGGFDDMPPLEEVNTDGGSQYFSLTLCFYLPFLSFLLSL